MNVLINILIAIVLSGLCVLTWFTVLIVFKKGEVNKIVKDVVKRQQAVIFTDEKKTEEEEAIEREERILKTIGSEK